jgi:hypothetical protein
MCHDKVAVLIDPEPSRNEQQQECGQSGLQNIISLPSDNMPRALTAVQQIMTEFNDAKSGETRAMAIHRPLKVIACNVNGIVRQCYELKKQFKSHTHT